MRYWVKAKRKTKQKNSKQMWKKPPKTSSGSNQGRVLAILKKKNPSLKT